MTLYAHPMVARLVLKQGRKSELASLAAGRLSGRFGVRSRPIYLHLTEEDDSPGPRDRHVAKCRSQIRVVFYLGD